MILKSNNNMLNFLKGCFEISKIFVFINPNPLKRGYNCAVQKLALLFKNGEAIMTEGNKGWEVKKYNIKIAYNLTIKIKNKILIETLKPVLDNFGLLLVLCISLIACNNYPEGVKKSLSLMNKENRLKFEKVFEYFNKPQDSLKLKAAYFLVENINGLGHYEGKQLRDYNVIFDILANKPSDYRENLPWYANGVNQLFDSLQNIYGQMDFRNLHFVKDEDVFTTENFIKYINGAFAAWQNPWSKNSVSFDNFCNYVLPYRNFNEPIEPWREMFTEKFKWIHDSIKGEDDIIDIARKLNRNSELKYSDGFGRYIVSIPPSLILKAMYGACTDNSNYKAMIMRSFGIPATIDYPPQYGNDHNTHYWNSVMDPQRKLCKFRRSFERYKCLCCL